MEEGEEKEERREVDVGHPRQPRPCTTKSRYHRIDHIRQDGMEEFLNCLVAIAWVIALALTRT